MRPPPLSALLLVVMVAACAHPGPGEDRTPETEVTAMAEEEPPLSPIVPAGAASAPEERAPVGWNRDGYWELRNEHKRSHVDGPRAGWTLAIRKADGCLLILASLTSEPPERRWTVDEIPLREGGRFWSVRDPATILEYLAEQIEDAGEREAIVGRMGTCTLGYRHLVDELGVA